MELKNRSFQYGKVALAVRTQYHQLQFVFKVVIICTDICMSLVQTVHSLLLLDFLSADPIYSQSAAEVGPVLNKTSFVRKFLQQLSSDIVHVFYVFKCFFFF